MRCTGVKICRSLPVVSFVLNIEASTMPHEEGQRLSDQALLQQICIR